MPTSAQRYEISPITLKIDNGTPATLNLAQMKSFAIESGTPRSKVRPGGAIDPQAFLTARAKPRVRFSTGDLTTYWGGISPTIGGNIPAASGAAVFRLAERDMANGFLTGAEHITITAGKGFVVPVRLSAEQESQDGADLESLFYPLYDGTNEPLVMADAVDFTSAPAVAFTSAFFLGPVYQNGTEIKGVIRTSVDFGLDFQPSPTTPGPFDDSGAIVNRDPKITFTLKKIDAVAAMSLFAQAVNTSLAAYFQKGGNNTTRVAKATAVHCKIGCTAGAIEIPDLTGQAADDALVNIIVHPTGTISAAVNSAIP